MRGSAGVGELHSILDSSSSWKSWVSSLVWVICCVKLCVCVHCCVLIEPIVVKRQEGGAKVIRSTQLVGKKIHK